MDQWNQFSEMPRPGEPQSEPPLVIKNQCTGTSRDGDRCKNSARFGMTVCRNHGGDAPQTLATRSRRFKESAGDAMNYMVAMLHDDSIDPIIRLRVAIAILDRTGNGPSASLKIGHDESAPWTAWLTNEEIELARQLRDRAIARMDAGEPQLGGVRDFSLPEVPKEVWLPNNDRPQSGEEVIEAVLVDARTEGQ